VGVGERHRDREGDGHVEIDTPTRRQNMLMYVAVGTNIGPSVSFLTRPALE
jgi:hypothetical protein